MWYKKWSFTVHGWRHFLVCISSASERKETWKCIHFLVILSLKTLWAGVKHWRTAPHRLYVYRKPISSPRSRNLKVIRKMCTFELKSICVWCPDNWSCHVSLLAHFPWQGYKYCNYVWPSLLFSLPPRILLYKILSHHFYPMICDCFFLLLSWPSHASLLIVIIIK